MAICDHLAPNGEKSILFQSLSQEYGEDKAHDIWEAIRTQQFQNKHPWPAELGTIQMQDNHMASIRAGAKDLTSRTESYHKEFYKGEGHYRTPQGDLIHLKDTGAKLVTDFTEKELDTIALREGFKSVIDMEKNGRPETQRWLERQGKKHFYEIEPARVDKNGEPTAEWVKKRLTIPSRISFLEEKSSGYKERTIKNASADATIALATDFNSAGEKLTRKSVLEQGKKYIPLDADSFSLLLKPESISKIVGELNSINAKSLNIAGNGIYTMKGQYTQKQVDDFTHKLLKEINEHPDLKNKIQSIRTGGQTGFDEAGAKAGSKLGIPTKILAPKGWKFRDISGTDISHEGQFKARFNGPLSNLPVVIDKNLPTVQQPDEYFDSYEEVKREQKTVSLEPAQYSGVDNRESEASLQKRLITLYEQAKANPDTNFIMDYKAIGVNRRYNSGYKATELANIFDAVENAPENVIFPAHLKALMMNSSRRIQEALRTDAPRELLNRNEEYVTNDLNRILIPKNGPDGALQGYFTTAQHEDIVKTALFSTQQLLARDPTFGANAIVKTFDNFRKIGEARGGNFAFIHDQRVRIAGDLLNQMADYGFEVTEKSRRIILQAVDNLALIHGTDSKLQELVPTHIEDTQELLDNNKEFAEKLGKGLADWGEVSFEHNPADTASGRMKMFLATQIDMDRGVYTVNKDGVKVEDYNLKDDAAMKKLAGDVNRKGLWTGDEEGSNRLVQELTNRFPTLPNKTFLGSYKLVDFESLHNDILETLADSPSHRLEDYLTTLTASGQPNMMNVAESVRAADKQIQNEFAKIVAMQYDDFIVGMHNKTTDETTLEDNFQLTPFHSNRTSQKNTLIEGWREAQKISEIMIKNAADERVIDTARTATWVDNLSKIHTWDLGFMKPGYIESRKFVKSMLKVSGIELTDDMINDLAKNTEKYTKGTTFSGGWDRQFSVRESDGQPNGMFSAFILKMAGKSGDQDIAPDENSNMESKLQMNNPLYTETTTMQILAKVAANHSAQLHSGSSRNVEGKNIWNFSMHSSLSRQFLNLTSDYYKFADRFKDVDFAQNNNLLKILADKPKYLDRMRISYLDGLKGAWQRRGVTRSDMSDREQSLMSMLLFQNKGEGYKKLPEVHYMSLTHADKTTTPIMFNMPKVDVGTSKTTPDSIVGKTNSAFYKIFQSEWQRITKQKDIDYNDSRYNKGKEFFYQIPEFNYDYMKKAVADKFLTKTEFEQIWVNGERNLPKVISPKALEVVNKILRKTIDDRINATKELWTSEGLLTENSHMFDKKYVSQLMRVEGIHYDEEAKTYINREKQAISKEDMVAQIGHLAAKDYALNNFLHNTSMAQLFFGDPAITHKGGGNDFVRVKATMDEYAKRLAKDIAPGLEPLFAPEDQKFNSITMKDVEMYEKYLDFMGDAYKNVNATDAQELTTVEEHLKVMHAQGLVPERMYNDMMQIVKAGKGKDYKFTNPEHLALILQPVKPVFSALRTERDGAMLGDYVKTSSYPLYPPATAGNHLDGLRVHLENNLIDRAVFESGKKIGAPSQPVQFFSPDGTFQTPPKDAVDRAIQTLDRVGFRIQQDVPYDEDKESIKTVSQMNKLIHEGIDHIQDFKIPGIEGTKTGKEVREWKETIRKDMIGNQLIQFNKDWNIQNNLIQDKSIVYDKLASLADRKRFTPNEVNSLLMKDDTGKLHIPLMFNTASEKFESMLMSMVKDVSQVKMTGKSYVQASSAGWKFNEDADLSNSRIVWASSYDGSGLKTMRPGTGGASEPAQVLVPDSFLGPGVKLEDITLVQNGKRVIDESKISREMLQLIGARIPNQGHSSMAAMEVVGILPRIMGDIIVVPAGFTKQMGADFDVDKLYTYRRPGFAESGVEMSKLQRQYFDVHWGVLTHPSMLEKVLKPLDRPDVKEENARLAPPADPTHNYFDVASQLADFQRGKDAKMLVALTSLSVTFNPLIQDKNLYYVKKETYIDENGMPKKRTVRDFITVIDEHTGKPIKLTNLSGNGKSNYTKEDGGATDLTTIRSKGDNHQSLQNAAVDNAKDRSLDNLNITPHTYNAAAAFLQLESSRGESANIKYATRLLTQPIIKEYAAEMKKGNDSLSVASMSNDKLRLSVLDKLYAKYGTERPTEPIVFDPQLLLKAQKMDPTSDAFKQHQLAVLDLFVKLDELGKRKSEIQTLFNQDTQGAGPNILTALDKMTKLENANLQSGIIANVVGIYATENNVKTEAGMTFDASTVTAAQVLTQLLPYDKFRPVIDALVKISGRDSMSIETQRGVLRSIKSFTYNSGEHFGESAPAERVRLFYNDGTSHSLARRIEEAKRTFGKDNYFLQRLDPKFGDTIHSPDYVEYNNSSNGRNDESNNDKTWIELLTDGNAEHRQLGEDLIRYAFFTGGVQDNNSFIKFVPNSYIAGTPFGGMLKARDAELTGSSESNPADVAFSEPGFTEQYIQHNPEQAFQITREHFTDLDADQNYPEVFKIDPDKNKLHDSLTDEEGDYRQFISYRSTTEGKWILYQPVYTNDGIDYFVRIDTLGNKYTDEYNGEASSAVRSIFTENRAMSDGIPDTPALAMLASWQEHPFGSPGDGHHPFDEIGLREGGKSAIDNALGSIAGNPRIPEALRTVARIYKETQIPAEEFFAKAIWGSNGLFEPKIVFTADPNTLGKAYSKGTIEMSTEQGTPAQAAEALLHELSHQRMQDMIRASGYDQLWNDTVSKGDPVKSAAVLERQERFQKANPQVMTHMRELDMLRYKAFNEFRNNIGEEAFERARENAAGDEKLTPDGRYYYGLSSMQEFVAHVMTDKSVQSFLNNIKHEGGSILDRVWQKFVDILAAVGKYLGKPVAQDSLLHEALMHTLRLSTLNQSRDVNITKGLTEGRNARVTTEAEARGAQEVSRSVYSIQVPMHSDPMGHTLDYGLKARARRSTNPIIANVDKALEKQLKEAYRDTTRGTPQEQSRARVRYYELQGDRADLLREEDNAMISQIANKQLNWVDQVLKNPAKDPITTQAAFVVTDIWDNMTELLYGEEVNTAHLDPTTSIISERAKVQRQALINQNAIRIVTDIFNERGIPFKAADVKELKDISTIPANSITLSRVTPILYSGTGAIMKGAANNRDEDMQRYHDRLVDIRKRIEKAGIKQDLFVQKDDWGLTSRVSAGFHKTLTGFAEVRDGKLSAIANTEFNLDKASAEKVRSGRKTEAWADYWDSVRKISTFVDSRVMFDVKTGEKLNDEKSSKAFQKLVTDVGSEDHANELVQKAQDRYKKYIQERDVRRDDLENTVSLTDEEMAGKSAKEQDELLAKKREAALDEWTAYNSPHEFLNRMNGKGRLKYVNDGDRWVVMAPKKEQTSFYDTRYTELMKNPVHAKIHEDYKQILSELVDLLPPGEKEKLPEDFLPVVSQETINTLANLFGRLKDWDKTLLSKFASTERDEWARIRPDEIPVMYTKPTARTKEIEDRSKDLIRIAEVFAHMALTYKHMSPVLDQVLMSERIVKEANRRRVNGDDEGPVLENALKMIQYNKDHLIFNKPRELEGKVDRVIYTDSAIPSKIFKADKEVKALTEQKVELQKQIDEKYAEGDNAGAEELENKLEPIDAKLTEYEKNARYIYASKAADVLMSVNQLKALSWNPFSAGANFVFALVSSRVYAAGKAEYDMSHLNRGSGIMMHAMKNYFTFGGAEDAGARKIRAVMERAQVMTELTGMEHKATHDRSHLKEAVSPFNWQKSGDYYAKGASMIAMMLKKTIDVVDKGTGQMRNVTLWEALGPDGTWDRERFEDNPDWYSEDVSSQKEWNKFRDLMRGVSTIIYGNQDKNSPLMAKRSMLWRLVGQFRMSWFPEGVLTRFGAEREDPFLGRTVKGRYRSFATIGMWPSTVIMLRSLLDQLPLLNVDRFKGITNRDGTPLKDVDKENMRRNFAGIAWSLSMFISITAIRATLQGGQGKKASSDDKRAKLLMNMLTRSYQDCMQYASPQVFDTITGNIMPVTTVVTDAYKAAFATGHYLFGDTHKDKHAFETMTKKWTKATPILNNINKTEYMFSKDIGSIQR